MAAACGQRVCQAEGQAYQHIDSAQKIIRIEQSKGHKDRIVMLSPETLDLLRQWWKMRPSRYDAGAPVAERWLFPGNRNRRYGARGIWVSGHIGKPRAQRCRLPLINRRALFKVD